jgi:hypothetical protein
MENKIQKTVKLPLLGDVILSFTPINPANSGCSNLIIADSTGKGKILLPHLEKESQPLLHTFLKMSISTYFHDFDLSQGVPVPGSGNLSSSVVRKFI